MNVIVILLGVSLTIAIGFLIAFLWSVRSGQYEDTYTPSVRILLDDVDNKSQNNTAEEKVREKDDGQQS